MMMGRGRGAPGVAPTALVCLGMPIPCRRRPRRRRRPSPGTPSPRRLLHGVDRAGSSPLDGASTFALSPRMDLVKNCRVHRTHWLISTQAARADVLAEAARCKTTGDALLKAGDAKGAVDASRAVWKSTSELGCLEFSRHRADAATEWGARNLISTQVRRRFESRALLRLSIGEPRRGSPRCRRCSGSRRRLRGGFGHLRVG